MFLFSKKKLFYLSIMLFIFMMYQKVQAELPLKSLEEARFTSLLVKDVFKTRPFICCCKSKNTDIIHQFTLTMLHLKLAQIQARSFGIREASIPISIHASCPLFGMLTAYLFAVQHCSLSLTLQSQMLNISSQPQL